MEPESAARDGPDRGSRESGRGRDGPARSEAERLRRENRRLEARLAIEKRRREHLIDRYEELLPDGSETDGDGRVCGRGVVGSDASDADGADDADPDSGTAKTVRNAVRRGGAWGRTRLRALRTRW